MLAQLRRCVHRAGAIEQQTLEQRVVEHVEQRRDERERSRPMNAAATENASASPRPMKMMPTFSTVL